MIVVSLDGRTTLHFRVRKLLQSENSAVQWQFTVTENFIQHLDMTVHPDTEISPLLFWRFLLVSFYFLPVEDFRTNLHGSKSYTPPTHVLSLIVSDLASIYMTDSFLTHLLFLRVGAGKLSPFPPEQCDLTTCQRFVCSTNWDRASDTTESKLWVTLLYFKLTDKWVHASNANNN